MEWGRGYGAYSNNYRRAILIRILNSKGCSLNHVKRSPSMLPSTMKLRFIISKDTGLNRKRYDHPFRYYFHAFSQWDPTISLLLSGLRWSRYLIPASLIAGILAATKAVDISTTEQIYIGTTPSMSCCPLYRCITKANLTVAHTTTLYDCKKTFRQVGIYLPYSSRT